MAALRSDEDITENWVGSPFGVEAALRRHPVRRLTDKLATTNSNCDVAGNLLILSPS
jgi:hypothetical protein